MKNQRLVGVVKSPKTLLNNINQQNQLLKNWITSNYGERCTSYEKGCVICEAWDYYDSLKLVDINSMSIPNKPKDLVNLKKRQANAFFEKIRDYPEVVVYLKNLIR